MIKKFRLDEFGFEIEVGRLAQQANGAVWFKQGGTVILGTAVTSPSQEFPGFLPLMVDYREYFSAAGKIPGGYFKREGKPSDKEVLTSRLIDRAIRPLFPEHFFDQIQILTTVYSVDKEHTPNITALVAASAALSISGIPFLGPIGAVEMCRINGEWVVNPVYEESKKADSHLVVAGTYEGICMVEGATNEVSEKECVDVFFKAHEHIKKIVMWQKEIQKELGIQVAQHESSIDWGAWESKVNEYLTQERVQGVFNENKSLRSDHIKKIKDDFLSLQKEGENQTSDSKKILGYSFEQVLIKKVTELVFTKNKRVDGRDFDQVRSIEVDVGVLPFTHGSGLFIRGNTQALVSVTLGGGSDEQKIENFMEKETSNKHFMLHYNFPPFSVGEVRPMRGVGRREVGHGHLAASALQSMLPEKEAFPYTIRIVADMLESDGSTSMATTCGSTMALMDAGVPLKKMVSGIAMGLLRNTDGSFKVLSDISGFEDAYGLMDFKVTGTQDGVTAIQMDIKYKGGLSRDIFDVALAQSEKSRMHILGEMRKVMTKPNENLSELVPKLVTVKINSDKIGAIIGSGGKTIREITETTNTNIDIESDGLVKIFGASEEDLNKAINWVKTLAGQIEIGAQYTGKIRRIVDFGLFVELVPGQDGLVHVSNIPRDKQRTFMRDFVVDDIVVVEVADYDPATGRIRLRMIEEKK